jgi:hypothetical protein
MATVHVEGISTKTSEDEIKSFFSFCGKIQSLSVTPTDESTQSASVTFEKPAAAKTALLLDNTQLGPNSVHVSSSKSIDELAGEKSASAEEAKEGDHDLEQEEKPKGRILAELLAHGYVIGDKAIERGLAADKQYGASAKFTQWLQNVDSRIGGTQKAQAVDNKFGVSQKVAATWSGVWSYFDKAAQTPTGQKLRPFYEKAEKTVLDVHNEATYLKKLKTGGAAEGSHPSAEEAGVEQIPGTDKTKCSCASDEGKCGCAPGKCACSGCGKAESTPASAST